MYDTRVRAEAIGLLTTGMSLSEASRRTGISRSTMRAWRDRPLRRRRPDCPTCHGARLDSDAYAALLGFYLGDGCISAAPRYYSLRVSCDKAYPRIIDDVTTQILAVRPVAKVFVGRAPGVRVVTSHWQHWPCLFPQHGPGRKHDRPIVLEGWQRTVVQRHPDSFLRGLLHSDGCRVMNWTTRPVAGQLKRYDYPRWHFTNHSADIRELCCWALDLVEVEWRQSNWKTISVSRRESVARLDEMIGPKT